MEPTTENYELLEMAHEAMENAYAKYSDFHVGASLLTKDGKVYTGFNIENVSFGLTNCAERTAIFHALASGEKPFNFEAIAITAHTPDPICPCGACLQVLVELGGPELTVIMGNSNLDKVRVLKLKELMPYAFTDTIKMEPKARKDVKKKKTLGKP